MNVKRDAWPTQPIPQTIEELVVDNGSMVKRLAASPAEIAALRAGRIPEDRDDLPFFYCEVDTAFFFRSWDGIFMFQVMIEKGDEGEKVARTWINNDPAQYRRPKHQDGDRQLLSNIIHQATREAAVATRESWKTLPMPEEREKLDFSRTISSTDYVSIKKGEIPLAMEDKWFMFVEGDWLYLHRSWTGRCLYQVRFEAVGDHFAAAEAWANRHPDQQVKLPAGVASPELQRSSRDVETLSKLIDRLIGRGLDKYYRRFVVDGIRLTDPAIA